MITARGHALFWVGPGTAFTLPVVDDADASLRLERARDIAEQQHRIFHLVERIDDQDGIEFGASDGSRGSVVVRRARGRRWCSLRAARAARIASIISCWTSTA